MSLQTVTIFKAGYQGWLSRWPEFIILFKNLSPSFPESYTQVVVLSSSTIHSFSVSITVLWYTIQFFYFPNQNTENLSVNLEGSKVCSHEELLNFRFLIGLGFSSLFAMAGFFLFLSFASIVAGVPSISFPINSQVPPVARVSGVFEFAFSPWTFTSDVQPISYTLASGPSWLMFDGITRNLYGTPAQEDVGSFTVKITATDSTGSADTEATFVVSSEIGPVVGRDIGSQLKNIGEVDGKGGLVFLPDQAYDFTIADDTFAPPGVVKRYEAVSTGNTPLPSWINFDGGRLKFTGTTPKLTSLIAPPQTWDVTLIASDYPGFAGASVSFQIVVGPHRILFEDTYFTTNAIAGSQFNYTIPRESIFLDNEPIASENLSSISITATDWLSFDPITYVLSGTPPQGADTTKVSIVARDVFGGEAQAELEISVLSPPTSIFTTEIPDFNVTSGEKFVYSFNRSSLSSKDVKLSVKYKPATVDWITFDAGNLQFRGRAPNDSLTVEVFVSAQSPGKLSDSRSFNICVTSSTSSVTSTESVSGTGAVVPTRTGFPKANDTSDQLDMSAEAVAKRRRKRTLIIVLATVLPLCVVCSFLFVWYFVSRQKDGDSSSYYSRSATPMGSEISRPLEALPAPWQLSSKIKDSDFPRRLSTFGYFTTDGSGRISNGFMSSMMSSDGTILRLGTPPTPPTPPTQLLPPPPENIERNSTAINFSKNPAIPRASYPSGPSYSLHPALAKSNSRGPAGHPAHQRTSSRGANGRLSRRLSDQSHRRRSSASIKGAANRRMSSGVGHGRPTFGGPPGYGVPKRSWRRTTITPGFWVGGRGLRESDATFETVSTEIFNQITQIGQTNNADQPSVRLVGDSPEGSAGKATQARARGSSPFFAGSATAWRRGSKMHAPPPPPVFKSSKQQETDQDSLMDDVIRAMSRENSQTKTIGTYSSLNLPETPMRRYNSALPSNFASSSSFGNYRVAGVADGEGEFKHVVDENGQRIWYPNRSRGSGITSYSRGGSSYYPYEPFEYGVAVTSTRAQGPAVGRPSSYEEERRPYILSKGAEPIPPPRQRAKLVDFTKKRPVSISEEGGEDDLNQSSFPGDMAYL